MPLTDVFETMRKHIEIAPISGASAIGVKFDYPDRFVAQRVTQDLVGRLIEANVTPNSRAMFELVDPPTLAQAPVAPNLRSQAAIGLFAGSLAGMLIFAILIRRKRSTPSPTCGRPMPVTVFPQTAGGSAGHL